MFKFCIVIFLIAFCFVSGAAEPWWHDYSTMATDPTSKKVDDIKLINADIWRASGWYAGWYGLWYGDMLRYNTKVAPRWQKVIDGGSRPAMYIDTGEVGDFVALIDEDNKKFLLSGWDWSKWNDTMKGSVKWYGLQSFMADVDWAPYRTAKDYDIDPFTYPDGSEIPDGKLYEVLTKRDMHNNWRYQYFSNPKITDEVAKKSGLADHSLHQTQDPDIQQGTGWVIGRLVFLDNANPQMAAYQAKEIEISIRDFQPAGIHVDDFGSTNIWGVSGTFGMWTTHTYREFMKEHFSNDELKEMGVDDIETFDIREYCLSTYTEEGVNDNKRLNDPRWYSDILFKCHLISKSERCINYAKTIYDSAKKTLKEEGLDGPVFGNVMPLLPSNGFMQGNCDVAHFEWKTINNYPGLPEVGLPPNGRVGYVTRVGERLSAASYCWPALYVPKKYSGDKFENLHKVLTFDAFANRGILDYNHWYLDNYSPGSDESAGYVNTFIKAVAPELSGREYLADVALMYCPWSQLASTDGQIFQSNKYLNEYKGWADYLSNNHAQFDVVLTTDVDIKKLKKYKAVVFPSVLVITETQISMLKRYLDNGGYVIATGETGIFGGVDDYLMPHKNDILKQLGDYDNFIRTDTKVGVDYYRGKCGEKEEMAMTALYDTAKFAPLLATNAKRSVGVNASILGDSISIDLNNFDYIAEGDIVNLTDAVEIELTLPTNFKGKKISVSMASPEQEGNTWQSIDSWTLNGNKLNLQIVPFNYFVSVLIK
jgi:hypothetical protein